MFQDPVGPSRSREESPGQSVKASLAFSAAVLAAVVTLGAFAPDARSDNRRGEIPFSVTEIFFELNDTDGDLGIHAKIDGGPWTRVSIKDPDGRKMLNIKVQGR